MSETKLNPWTMALNGVANALLIAEEQGRERGYMDGARAGYGKAVDDLGTEGDYCRADWREPYEYLLARAAALWPHREQDSELVSTPWGMFDRANGTFPST